MADVTPMRIAGERVDHGDRDDEVLVVRSPWDGHEVGRVPAGTTDDLDAAVAGALAAHRAGAPPAHVRATVLDRAAAVLAERVDDFARSITDESAKPIKAARVEAARAVDTFRFAAAVARTATGETVPLDASSAGEGKVAFVLRVPRGVVGAITPFNFPLNLVAHKVAPAIAAGCPVVLKPAPNTPLTALHLADVLLDEAGLDPAWLQVVTCDDDVAPHLVAHPDVAVISFTGSAAVGWSIAASAPRKKVGLELGNNAPVIVEPDADLPVAAAKVAAGGFAFAGQTCISVQRVYVHRSVHQAFLAELVLRVGALVVGDPTDPATDVSALITSDDTTRVQGMVEEAVGGGARVVVGGTVDDRGVLGPTVLDGVTADMAVCRREVFGPVVGVAAYDDFDEAVALANDTAYGLQAAVFTASLTRALEAGHRLEFGGVLVNEMPTFRADQMPYGGVKESGNTREGPAYAVDELTERRLVVLDR